LQGAATSFDGHRKRRRRRFAGFSLVVAMAPAFLGSTLPAPVSLAGSVAAVTASAPFAAPGYFRPVVVDGKAFPVARSNFLSLIEFTNDWHAPRLRLINGKWELVGVHQGVDITAERGAPILAMEPGIVENAGWTFYSGTRVGVRGIDGRYYLYAHLSRVSSEIAPGASVRAGTLLGLVGNTGYGPPGHRDEFPPHLHFGIESGSEWISPYLTLVALYAATVRANQRALASLDRLASSGDRAGWARAATKLFMDFGG
jgi:murein DD-endopeptidase MepM/ murein hydrolase activator NlpD